MVLAFWFVDSLIFSYSNLKKIRWKAILPFLPLLFITGSSGLPNLDVRPVEVVAQLNSNQQHQQSNQKNQDIPPEPVFPIPNDAINDATIDLKQSLIGKSPNPLTQYDLPFIRWIWVPSLSMDDIRSISDTLNKITRDTTTVRPIVVTPQLLRIDLRNYAPIRTEEINEWLQLWENFQFDPWFSQLITKGTIDKLTDDRKSSIMVEVTEPDWFLDKEKNAWIKKGMIKKKKSLMDACKESKEPIQLIRINAPHLDNEKITALQVATGSIAPVVHYSYFQTRVLSTIKDKDKVKVKDKEVEKDNVYSLIWGGLYYEFSGIKKSKDAKKKTDLDQLLEDLGILQKFETLFDKLLSDEKVAMFQSQITGKPRGVTWFPSLASRISQTLSAVFLTLDIRDQDVDIDTHAMANLVKANGVAAYEVIYTRRNGQNGFALFDGNQVLLDAGADNVVSDHTVPSPYTTRLQSGISCIRCHGKHDGWQPLPNDAKILVQSKLNIYGDTTNANEPIQDTQNRIDGLYKAGPKIPLEQMKRGYATATFAATGPWPQSKLMNVDVVKLTSEKTADIWFYDRYSVVDAKIALQELGINPGADPVEQFNKVLPPDKRAEINGIIPEDFRIAGLKKGLKIVRTDWHLVFSYAMERVLFNQKEAMK